MRLNADFNERVVLRPEDRDWVASPMAGVDRQMLDRIGEVVARATSIVRYAPDSYFSEHTHGGGEEFFVLEGVFSDEHGDYPAGTYVRNPIGSKHRPHSKDGCTIFVKLHQFDVADTEQTVIDTQTSEFLPGQVQGLTVLPLHSHGTESAALVRWAPRPNSCHISTGAAKKSWFSKAPSKMRMATIQPALGSVARMAQSIRRGRMKAALSMSKPDIWQRLRHSAP